MPPIDLRAAAKEDEQRLIASLRKYQAGLTDPNGKGNETEGEIEQSILQPHLPPDFRCRKGNVIESGEAGSPSHAIDRVVYDASAGSPLLLGVTHCTFPIEVVVAAIEITMSLDATKLKNDMSRLSPFRGMRERQYLSPIVMSSTMVMAVPAEHVAPRSFVIGLPSDPAWSANTIAGIFSNTQKELKALVHGLYVIGIGFFVTDLSERSEGSAPNIECWTGEDRLFRFTCSFRQSLDRWPRLPQGVTANMNSYIPGQAKVFTPTK